MAFYLTIDRYGNEQAGGGSSFSNIVYFNATNPNSATIFDLNNPPTTNNDGLKANDSNLYVGTDGNLWVWNSASNSYVSYVENAPYVVHAHSPAAQSIPTSVSGNLANFGTTLSNNTAGAWNAAAGTFTASRAGFYQVTGQVEWASTTWPQGTIFAVGITKNNTNIATTRTITQATYTGLYNTTTATGIIYLAVGDVIRLTGFQASGGARSTAATSSTYLTIHEIK